MPRPTSFRSAAALALVLMLATAAAPAQRVADQDAAFAARRAGQMLPLRTIEDRILPKMSGARYLGPEMHDDGRLRLKFIRGTAVIWVDVDARTGAVIGRSGG